MIQAEGVLVKQTLTAHLRKHSLAFLQGEITNMDFIEGLNSYLHDFSCHCQDQNHCMMKANLLNSTPILDYNHPSIQLLVAEKGWGALPIKKRLQSIYNYVRDDIKFGYNKRDDLKASEILKDGYGQCNTKSTLLMALLRAVGIPTRLHGFTIEKSLQKGAITGIWYALSPKNILHTWVEVLFNDQ